MSTNEDKAAKRAVVFEEGAHFRAVASWVLHDVEKKLMLDTIELEMLGVDALGAPRWESYGCVVVNGLLLHPLGALVSASSEAKKAMWLGYALIARADRWLKENV